MKKVIYLLLALAVLAALIGLIGHIWPIRPIKPNTPAEQLDSICRQLFPSDEPGAAVLVMRHDSVLFDKGYGLADLETRMPIDGNTFFNIASVSKQFTAVAVLQLAEQGKLSLDDAVAQYFPFRNALWKEVRIRHLLSHSSGVPDLRGGIPREQKLYGTDSLAIAYLNDLDHLHFSPGTDYEYMNPTFVLCGAIVEKVSGQPFSTYMQEHVFAPAHMHAFYLADSLELLEPLNSSNSSPKVGEGDRLRWRSMDNRMAHGYEYEDVSDMPEERTASAPTDEPKHWYEYDLGEETFFATRPDGGLYTTIHDFVNWEKYLNSLNSPPKIGGEAASSRFSGSIWGCDERADGSFRTPKTVPEGGGSMSNLQTYKLTNLQTAWSPQTKVSGSPWSEYQNRPNTWYGYGWFIEPATDSTKTVIYHTGDNGGFKILAARYPEDDALVLVFANRADWDRYALKQQIEHIFGL